MTDSKAPTGVVAIVNWPTGEVLASLSDFASPRGMQKQRVEAAIIWAAVNRLANPILGKALEGLFSEWELRRGLERQGFKFTTVNVPEESQ